ncbi:mitochondrial ribosomal protein MRP51 [Durotheca rogersii]|uniref:mitochondrial ribosomal protein MRP51 n=1 Tax=Durotheca rogersii TaxID=419775 RepID=UPI00221E517A|nr:mitochondrial ribosomal protein MRP51 [Durotheca rogersii]KAI5868600.1 mitochondrial ribosomal protein MRP51 [Durotheca rogersii]
MAGRSVSPGAALLRSSRMFSMPAPIPAPLGDLSSATKHYSPTATISFPTHLTVTTPHSSRIVGDWGFKRPFPLKTTTNTTHALVRVKQVDAVEQVTDFQSASDHTVTLWKYQEMNMPVSVPAASNYDEMAQITDQKSVFEEDGDVTALDDKQKVELVNKRWKFTGPWLAGMLDGEFNKYIEKKVRTRRSEFRAFLRETLAAEMTAKRMQEAKEHDPGTEPAAVSASEISDDLLTEYLRHLRQERVTLYKLVSQFLDLAPIDLNTAYHYLSSMKVGKPYDFVRANPYGSKGPPITHPSAGLSYLRTRNFQEHHPIYGPQKYHTPIKTRVLKPVNHTMASFKPSIGIAGFVGSTLSNDTTFNAIKQRNQNEFSRSLHELELVKHGGAKIYVQPTSATIDSSGRVIITIGETNPQAELVQRELVGEADVFQQVVKSLSQPVPRQNPRNTWSGYQKSSTGRPQGAMIDSDAASYGFGSTMPR